MKKIPKIDWARVFINWRIEQARTGWVVLFRIEMCGACPFPVETERLKMEIAG